MVSPNNPHGSRRRGILDMDRIGDSMSRVLHGAGGEGTNSMFLFSFAVLVVMILVLVTFTGNSNDAPTSAHVPHSNEYANTDNLKHPESHRQVQPRPSNLNLLIIGNATAHYSYLSLVYYLRWGRWFDPGLEKSNLVNEESFDNPFHNAIFGEFHYQTNVMLEPYELCDCHKSATNRTMRELHYENRYFHDPKHNNTVTYIHAYGEEVPLQGRLNPEDLYTNRWTWSNKEKGLLNPEWDSPEWQYDTWANFIKEYVPQIKPTPEYALMESSGFRNSFGPGRKGRKHAEQILQALEDAKIRPFWRTAAYDQTHSLTPEGVVEYDKSMCGVIPDCVDLDWTKEIRSDLYWENYYFHEPVHRVFNEELLESIGKLPEGYVKYDKNLLF